MVGVTGKCLSLKIFCRLVSVLLRLFKLAVNSLYFSSLANWVWSLSTKSTFPCLIKFTLSSMVKLLSSIYSFFFINFGMWCFFASVSEPKSAVKSTPKWLNTSVVVSVFLGDDCIVSKTSPVDLGPVTVSCLDLVILVRLLSLSKIKAITTCKYSLKSIFSIKIHSIWRNKVHYYQYNCFLQERNQRFVKIILFDQIKKKFSKLKILWSSDLTLQPATSLKKRLWRRCFPMNFTKF